MADSRYWSKEIVANFIEIYKGHPCLWKVKSKDYTNKNLKNLAYDKLVDFCKTFNTEANRDYVIKKIQSFRGSFRKELKKLLQSKRSGAGVPDVYEPTLWYYDLLLFTCDQEIPNASVQSNMSHDETVVDNNSQDDEEEENQDTQLSEHTEWETDELVEERRENKSNKDLLLTENDNASNSTPKSAYSSGMKSLSTTPRQKKKTTIKKRNEEFMEFCKQQLQAHNDIDEYDAVGISWAKKLKRMNPEQAVYAESLINSIVSRGLLNKLSDAVTLSDANEQRPASSSSSYTLNSSDSRQCWQVTLPCEDAPQPPVVVPSSSLVEYYTSIANINTNE
ncbi:hypothetical protein PPYR_00030 [Photinus pyralis]|uniref:MADF domain-containing protein n=2 Tax=Photinus pyralis TaxID=7054 RepID=A0A5N4B0X4_PHOPY|nr:uncharacterized protein LOC116167367 [Photinus pyralis]KAB0803060.1 hypothetical protein PPYR_00030 [Photinus pyralis]